MQEGITENRFQEETIPWEDRSIGLWQSFWLNWVQIIFSPKKFFTHTSKDKGIASPFLFYILSFSIYIVISFIFTLLRPSFKVSNFIFGNTIYFLISLGALFLISGIIYFFLSIFGIKDKWQNAFCLICYAEGATTLFETIPVLGILIGFIWGIFLVIIGIKNVFKVSVGKAVSVYFSSFFTFIIFFIGLVFMLTFATGMGLFIFKPDWVSRQFEKDAISNCKKIVVACETFKKFKGFYPITLSQLSSEEMPYLDSKITKATAPLDSKDGYFFIYTQLDEMHYTVYAKPVKRGWFDGQRAFFVDQSGIIRINDATGPPVIEEKK